MTEGSKKEHGLTDFAEVKEFVSYPKSFNQKVNLQFNLDVFIILVSSEVTGEQVHFAHNFLQFADFNFI